MKNQKTLEEIVELSTLLWEDSDLTKAGVLVTKKGFKINGNIFIVNSGTKRCFETKSSTDHSKEGSSDGLRSSVELGNVKVIETNRLTLIEVNGRKATFADLSSGSMALLNKLNKVV